MSRQKSRIREVRTDVFIIGSEASGAKAAIEAHAEGVDVIVVTKGLLPMILLAGIVAVSLLILRRRFNINRNEAVQAIFILFIIAYGVLTFIGVWFRGAGMELVRPW